MFSGEMEIEIERRVIARLDERAKAGLPAISHGILRGIVRADLEKEIEDKRQASRRPVSPPARPAPVPPRLAVASVKPSPPKVAAKPVPLFPLRAVPPAPTAAEIAERTRVQRIRALTRKGGETEAAEAIRSGMSAAEFEGIAAARLILDAGRRARGAR